MSVIVKGMDMPKDCGHCRFAVDGWCYAYGRANIDALSTYERTNYCPLVPVPPKMKESFAKDINALDNASVTVDTENKLVIYADECGNIVMEITRICKGEDVVWERNAEEGEE